MIIMAIVIVAITVENMWREWCRSGRNPHLLTMRRTKPPKISAGANDVTGSPVFQVTAGKERE